MGSIVGLIHGVKGTQGSLSYPGSWDVFQGGRRECQGR